MKKLSFLVTFLCSTGILLGTTTYAALPTSPNTWAEINANPENYPNALALEMDEPLYNAIYDTHATEGTPKLDNPSDINSSGWITIEEAASWGKNYMSIRGQPLQCTLRGIRHFKQLKGIYLGGNQLHGEIPREIGQLTGLTLLRLQGNLFLSGNIPDEIGLLPNLESLSLHSNMLIGEVPETFSQLSKLKLLELYNNRLSGTFPALHTGITDLELFISLNPNLCTPHILSSGRKAYENYKTACSPEYGLNRTSTGITYANSTPQDGSSMILNRDTHNDGHANINLVQQWSVIEPPMYNIDINGDDIADINILIDVEIGKGKYEEMVVFNQAKFITTTSDGVLGWIRSDYDYATGMMKSDFEVSQDYPYYVVAKTTGALIPNTTTPPLLLQLDKHINGKILNTDSDNDGIPDINIDTNADDKPDYNLDYNGDNIAHFNNGVHGEDNIVQTINNKGLNYDSNNDGRPDFNIDLNEDGIADEKIDANGNGIVDSEENKPAPSPSSSGGGGGGASLSKDSCPNGDFSASYYDKTCGTTADVADEVAKKVNVLRPLIVRIFLTATEAQKNFVHDIITSCSQINKKEIIKLACQELVADGRF